MKLLPFVKKNGVLGLGVVGAFTFVHGFLFMYYAQWLVLGFDSGFYRRYLLEPLSSIPHASVPGLDHTVIIPRVWLDLFRLSGLSTDVVLYLSYVAACAFLFSGLFFFVRSRSTTSIAVITIVLVLFSPVYIHGYWFFLYKNILAVGILFWLLYCLQRRFYAGAFLLVCLIPITHQSTTIFAGILLFLLAIFEFWHRRPGAVFLGLWFILTSLYLLYHPTIVSKIVTPPTALFLTPGEFILMTWPLFLMLSYLATSVWILLRRDALLLCALGLSAVWMIGSFPYAERMGFFVIFFLAITAATVLSKHVTSSGYLALGLSFYAVYGTYFLFDHKPYLDASTEMQLGSLDSVPRSASVLTTNYLASTVQGYTTATVYAPGLFKDPAPPVAWEFYWSHQSGNYDRAFLASFPAPLYLFIPPADAGRFLPVQTCLAKQSQYLYKYICTD